jgi:hypothetical protein
MIRSPAIRSSWFVQNLPVTHDAFFRALLDEPGVAAALLREHLPVEVAALLAPDAPELLDAHFVAAHLRHSQADRLYRARALAGGEVYIYVLLEHKSGAGPGGRGPAAGLLGRDLAPPGPAAAGAGQGGRH